MHKPNRIHRSFLPGLAATVLLVSPPALAEVGVIQEPQGPTSYVLQSIVDEPEPIDNAAVWMRFSAASSGRQVLNENGYVNGDGPPSLIPESGTRLPLAAWSRNSPAGYDVVFSRFDGTQWTPPLVLAGSPADELDPHLCIDPADGSVHLVYWIHDGSPRVMHRQAPADLSAWSPPVQVSEVSDIAVRPTGAFHDGALRVAYELHDSGYGSVPRQIVLATRDGSTFTSQILTSTQYAGENRPTVHSVGDRLWVDWIDTDSEMTWIRQIGEGPWETVQVEIYGSTEERDFHVRGLVRQHALD